MLSSFFSKWNSRGVARRAAGRWLVPGVELLERRTVLSQCGPFDLGDGLGPKFIGDGVTTFSEDFSDNPNHEDQATAPSGVDRCEAQGERLFSHNPSQPFLARGNTFDLPPFNSTYVLAVGRGNTHEIQFLGIHPDYEVAAVGVDVLSDGFGPVRVEFVGVQGTMALEGTGALFAGHHVATRGSIIPGAQTELGSIQSIRFVNLGAFAATFDNVTLLIAPREINDPPIALNDQAFVLPSRPGAPSPIRIDVLANDDDPEGHLFSLVSITAPPHGTAVIDGNSVIYTPEVDFHDRDSFAYMVRDDKGLTSAATVHVAVNTPPSANSADFFFPHGTFGPVSVPAPGVLASGFDADGDPLTAELVGQPEHGFVVLNADGSFTYTPTTAGGLLLPDAFSYRVFDGFQRSNAALVGVNVPNQSPTASNVELHAAHAAEGPLFGRFLGVDGDGDALQFEVGIPPAHGNVRILPHGWFAYEPDHREFVHWPTGEFMVERKVRGPDSFTYHVRDNYGGTSSALVDVVVPNLAPRSNPFGGALGEDRFVAPSSDAPTDEDVFANVLLGGENVVPSVPTPATGRMRVELAADRLDFRLDVFAISNVVAVRLHWGRAGENGPAVATLYSHSPGGGTVIVNPLVSGQIGAVELVGPFAGNFSALSQALRNGEIYVSVYTDDGVPVFQNGQEVETGPGDFFVAGEIRGQIEKTGDPVRVAAPGPLFNDFDNEDGDEFNRSLIDDPLTMIVLDEPDHGRLRYQADGSFFYYPEVGFTGLDGFTYIPTDGFLSGAPATVTIEVIPRGDALVLRDDSYTFDLPDFERFIIPGFQGFDTIGFNDVIPADSRTEPEDPNLNGRLELDRTRFSWSECFVGTRHATYGAWDGFSFVANFASLTIHVNDADQDGDGFLDSEEGLCLPFVLPSPDRAYLDANRRGSRDVDTDGDGVSNHAEGLAPGGGDANADGILDARQGTVGSIQDTVSGAFATFIAPPGARLVGLHAAPVPGGLSDVDFPLGLFELSVQGVFPGVPVAVEILLPGEPRLDTYYNSDRRAITRPRTGTSSCTTARPALN